MGAIEILDSTLRDGAQGEGISFTTLDKLAIVKKLDKLGISYIEAGNPSSNPKDIEFFEQTAGLKLTHARLVAFGSTRHKECKVEDDKLLKALIATNTEAVSIVGKASLMQVMQVLNTTAEENLAMIEETISYLKKLNKTVIFDAEHFFDGYHYDKQYALKTLLCAERAGADVITLCDTNGATLIEDIQTAVEDVASCITVKLGIHCHNDIGMAVANTLTAVRAGITHVQGTYIGFGERCGNANLSTIIPTLQLKYGYSCIPESCMKRLTKTARFVAEAANLTLDNSMPYVGKSAFAHKGGMHVDGVRKQSSAFEHIKPGVVGNTRSILLSEQAGRAAMLSIISTVDPTITKDSTEAEELVAILKEQEHRGYLYETATASLELVIAKHLHRFKPFFELMYFKVNGTKGDLSTALIKINMGSRIEITAAEGEGPVHALDVALKKAVTVFYPQASSIHLTDYKVRVMEPSDAAAAMVRVIVTSTDGVGIWTTVGVSRDIVDASLQAIMDSIEYKLMRETNSE